ncbi:trigger factor [Candidatus Falkowbacteria bacterium RIFOXYB2_FULL_34_18]|uniref:Trigger factor n=1 Tax=Candidatus Falkowbacteria bacterium RIFOXYD2_FULL_34_120 TaxID=1798007 RepID=A0A1F5TRG6_9BACT|nr:MAG: trigger factor [Candidatus Falkowbacteria bacterium RIFOXYB2_FULL_34_18]OGF29433.1 MAG: trigger factor [Candidatus Falkowbacteria bacterium RIFOXYC12_FULL_34_55]OGF36746.1 MAG: trigger factor [Candidatus Falkowbacteria bacterium RIFOXYC2_FULL_34_220]OGF38959.1 MAG: trigger factor [Candidatus Falkowbacteria bacterium RIFOXYD12_FULL_34_57]OGF41151.1 MAG: trigger factor [Candidatus Falkowbacteria bacterium RIFOXYD2_FULL_34_120]
MKVEKKDLKKSQIELIVELSVEEFKPYIQKGAEVISKEVKIDGFRPGKVPYEVLKKKIGEMSILEESARIAINKTLGEVIAKHVEGQPVGQPKIDITKIAPNNPMEFKVTLDILPEVVLGVYKDLKIKRKKIEVTKQDIEKMLTDLQSMRASEKAVEREIKDTDKALVDIQMFSDGIPLEDGQSKDTAIMIGKDYVVPGFDKQLLGAKKGDKKEFSLPYPKEHYMKNLAGKMVEFKVIIKGVFKREMPEIDDKFAESMGIKKLDELKKNIEQNIVMHKQQEMDKITEKEMFEKIINKTKFGDIPENLIKNEAQNMMREIEQGVLEQGGKFEDYLSSIKKTHDQMVLELLPDAVRRVKASLLIREVSIKEKIEATKEDVQKNIEEMKKKYKDNKEAVIQLNSPEYQAYILNVLTSQKVVDKLKEWNIVE